MNQSMSLVSPPAQAPAVSPTTAASLEAIKSNFGIVQAAMQSVLIKDVHYGVIPGTGDKAKPTLLKPGADVLCALFHLAPAYDYQSSDLGSGHREYMVTCTLGDAAGRVLGQGVGLATTLEPKYRYRKGGIVCPRCGKPTIYKSKQDKGGGWFCWAKKGGCGVEYRANDQEITGQQVDEKVEHQDPAEYYNTCLKMAAKRAQVSAVLTVTGASAVLTQDLEDFQSNIIDAEYVDVPPMEPSEDELLAELAEKAGLSEAGEKADLARFVRETAAAQKKEVSRIITAGLGYFDSFQTAFQKWLKKQQAATTQGPAVPPNGNGQTPEAAPASPAKSKTTDIGQVSGACFDICKNRGLDLDAELAKMFPGQNKSKLGLEEWQRFHASLL